MASDLLQVAKITLSTKKEVIIKLMKISDSERAAEAVSKRAKGDQVLTQLLMQKELVKNLLIEINGKKLTASEREDMDALFSPGEYSQVLKVVNKMAGGDDEGNEPQIEVVSYGAKSPLSVDTQV